MKFAGARPWRGGSVLSHRKSAVAALSVMAQSMLWLAASIGTPAVAGAQTPVSGTTPLQLAAASTGSSAQQPSQPGATFSAQPAIVATPAAVPAPAFAPPAATTITTSNAAGESAGTRPAPAAAKTGNLVASKPLITRGASTHNGDIKWRELNAAQKLALNPLAGEWDQLPETQRKKWLTISASFSSLQPEQQQKIQDNMRVWARLTPDQRRVARESYTRVKKLGNEEKTAEWQQYQQLSDEQKEKLATELKHKKQVTNLPRVIPNKTPPPAPLPRAALKSDLKYPAAPAAAIRPSSTSAGSSPAGRGATTPGLHPATAAQVPSLAVRAASAVMPGQAATTPGAAVATPAASTPVAGATPAASAPAAAQR